ncbi:hypothetical protein G6M89_21795 [Natronolimnobius sp. AArcel1]|uniref:hypothetical protein n=1 Tax=Natronolimnobius sp. AArcel1 TaxID=1679093 RepID=UPI0013EA5D45|nr:hypothetical protein [Natronolimnobius sp. AArcel1]NGM71581.1 hypothetical protein [Natronolimnobius sp. AArcel1]
MFALMLGLLIVVFGLAGLRYAATLVEHQNQFELTMYGAEELDTAERVRVTKLTASVVIIVGFGIIAYGLL